MKMTVKTERRFKVGDRVEDIAPWMKGEAGTVLAVRTDDDGQHKVKVRYDTDNPGMNSGWWPEADYVLDEPAKVVAGEPFVEWEPEEKPTWPRQKLLEEAIGLTCGDRNAQYGDPLQDFKRSAKILNAMGYKNNLNGMDRPLSGHDVALIVAAVKMSRIAWQPTKRDSWVDLAGYAACGWENVEGQLREDATD